MSNFRLIEETDSFPGFQESSGTIPDFQEIAKGDKGDPGRDFQISGFVEAVADLPTGGEVGECWLVGTESPYNGYMWNGTVWVDIGPILEGPPGQDYVLTPADKNEIAGIASELIETDLQPQIDSLVESTESLEAATESITQGLIPVYANDIEGSGTSSFSISNKSFVKFGKLVIGSVRGSLTAASSIAMDLPLLSLQTYPPDSSMTGIDNKIPSRVSIVKSGSLMSYAGLAWIKTVSGVNYLCQCVTSTLSSGDSIEIMFVYYTA